MVATILPKCVFKKVLVDKHTIDNFYIYQDERRKIRRGKVLEMVANFDRPDKLIKHFDSPIVVNVVDDRHFQEEERVEFGKRRVIDGNHRMDAIAEKLLRDSDFRIVITIAEYKNLNRAEERQVYTKWNKGTPESATDYLKWHFKTIPYGKQMLNQLPVEIYGNDKKMSIKMLVGSHVNAKKQNAFEGGYSFGGEKTVQDFMMIVPSDIKTMALFYEYMVEAFGTYYKGHPFYRSTPLSVFYRIWFDNKDYISRERFVTAFKRVFAQKLFRWDDIMKNGGRSASIFFYNLAMKELEQDRRRIHWRYNQADTPSTISFSADMFGKKPEESEEDEEDSREEEE
jgi:hypothetical protein